ncbi:MAG: serine/threonine protein kinase [Candidatus Obscuribacterales bacterium]|nr:serine/threonine protein kinase [Candidatus Obscuribacterales bacterium]
MAELVIKSQCRSLIRESLEGLLDFTFPLWGIVSPLAACCMVTGIWRNHVDGRHSEASGGIIVLTFPIVISVLCVLLRRVLRRDSIVIDREGIRLPRLFGWRLNTTCHIPWERIVRIYSSGDTIGRCRLTVERNDGRRVVLDTAHMRVELVEQFLLAAKMWAPGSCDAGLETLKESLRASAKEASQASYTDLWDEELGRRFSPTSYIPLEVGTVLRNSSLRVVSHLASGGLSALYLCQLNENKLVVLKEATIPDGGADILAEKAAEMFKREAELLAKVNHPNIVSVVDSFTENKRNYMLMEYVNGVDLRQLVKQNGPQKEADVLEWAVQIGLGVKYLHERETAIIHRDLTPDNIVLRNDGKVIIVDFGAANELIGTATGTFVGKHAFIAPEQLRGKASTHSDIYAFGCTLYFLLTGQDPEALCASNPRDVRPSISQELGELVESCTQMEARDRYQSMSQLLPVLRRLSAQSYVS